MACKQLPIFVCIFRVFHRWVANVNIYQIEALSCILTCRARTNYAVPLFRVLMFTHISTLTPVSKNPHNKLSTTAGNANLRIGHLRPRESFPMRSILRTRKSSHCLKGKHSAAKGEALEFSCPSTPKTPCKGNIYPPNNTIR